MANFKKIFEKGVKVKISDYGFVGDPLGVIVSGIPRPVPTRYGNDYEHHVRFITPCYDLNTEGPYNSGMVMSQSIIPIHEEYSSAIFRSGMYRLSVVKSDLNYRVNLSVDLYIAQFAMTDLYLHGRESDLPTDEQRALYHQVIAMAQAEQEKCVALLPELEKLHNTAQPNAVNAPLEFLEASDRHYALQQSMKINDFFVLVAREELDKTNAANVAPP